MGSEMCIRDSVISAGQVTSGAISSIIVIVWIQVASFPQASTAFHVLVIEPALPPQSAKVLLLLSSKVITISAVAVQLSAAIAEPPAILGSVDWSQLSVTSGGQIKLGISSSTIVILC